MFAPDTTALLLWLIPLLAATGLVAGTLAGLLGVGGGIVVVPVLYHLFSHLGIDPSVRMHLAVGTSLATIIPTSIRSVRAHMQRGGFEPELFKAWAPAVFAGSVLGTWLATLADFSVLTSVFGIVGLLMALQMGLGNANWRLGTRLPRGPASLGFPVMIGGLSAMMGIGGGTFSVPALTLFGTPIHRAVGTSSGFGLVISIPATIGFAIGGWNVPGLATFSVGYVNALGLLLIVPTTLLTVPLGARLAHSLSQHRLRQLFGIFLGITAGRMLWDAISAAVGS